MPHFWKVGGTSNYCKFFKKTTKLHDCFRDSPDRYSGHSLRRGNATFALQCGLPVDLIKIQGDWKSNCVETYLESSFLLRKKVADSMGSGVKKVPLYVVSVSQMSS